MFAFIETRCDIVRLLKSWTVSMSNVALLATICNILPKPSFVHTTDSLLSA